MLRTNALINEEKLTISWSIADENWTDKKMVFVQNN